METKDDDKLKKHISPDEVARELTAFSAFLQSSTTDEGGLAQAGNEAATMARANITAEKGGEEAEEEQETPVWAANLPHPENIFVEKTHELELWHPVAKSAGKNNEEVEIRFRRMGEELVPGGTVLEQGVELGIVKNHFSNDEWEYVVKPILERYVNALELRILSRSVTEKKKDVARKIKQITPQVFRAGEIPDLEKIVHKGKEFRRIIGELVNEMNTNPQVLKKWINEELKEEEPEPIQRKVIEKGKGEGRKYEEVQKKAGLRRLMQPFEKGAKQTFETYVDDLADRISKLATQLLFLNSKKTEGLYKPPKVKKDFVETPYMTKCLEYLAERVTKQLDEKKGMVSIIGEMGTGKNYLVEHFAAKTNRPFFYFPCSRGMDTADLGFHFEFRKGESYIMPSALARGLKTKNAVILIDEPNALPPEVVAGLHGLADHNRSFVYNGVEFKAAEGVVIIMTMNPAFYEHVKDLPEAFSDRTLGMDMVMDYPPLTKLDQLAQENLWSSAEREQALQADNSLDQVYICDEALIVKNQFPDLKNWSDEDFTNLWDVVVNGQGESVLGDKANQVERLKPFVKAIFVILKVCDAWRKRYKNGDMQRTISLRGSTAVAENFLRTKNVRKAFLDLYKPNSLKYDGGEEDYESLEQILNDKDELDKLLNEEIGV